MLTDPHYARVMDALPLILAARRDAAEAAPEPAAAIRSDYAVFLPVVIRGSSGTGGTPGGPPAGFAPRKGDIFLVREAEALVHPKLPQTLYSWAC